MTAHAMKGDRERCLEAGMDGYVSKPIQPHDLNEAIGRIDATLPEVKVPQAAPSDPADGVDVAEALARVGNEPELLRKSPDSFSTNAQSS